jgi:hypothetical protein
MPNEQCNCGYPHCRPNDNFCIKCNKLIKEQRLSVAEVVVFPPDFASKPCKCNDTVKSSWGIRSIDELKVCGFCGQFLEGVIPGGDEGDLAFFSDLDLPYTLDPSKYQYKVITQKDRFFSSKFNPALIERALNEYAQEGWTFKAAVSADFGSLGMSRNELIIFMEKEPNGEVDS